MPYEGPTPAELAEARTAFANLLPTDCTVWRKNVVSGVEGAFAQIGGTIKCRVAPYRPLSGKGENAPLGASDTVYRQVSLEDLRNIYFGYTGGGTVAPDIKRNDQIRVGTNRYNVLDLVGDTSFGAGLTAICQRSK